RVLSLKDGKFISKKVVRIGTKNIDKALKFVLETGEVIEVSCDHPFYSAIKRDIPGWNKARQIKIGDFLAVPRKSEILNKLNKTEFKPFSEKDLIPVRGLLKEHCKKYNIS